LPFNIVLDGPTGWRLRAATRRAPTVIGALLVCLGALLVLPLIVLTITVVIFLIVRNDLNNHPEKVRPEWFEKIRGDLVPLWLSVLTVVMLSVIVGLKLLRSNRNVILFLRRFGYPPATYAITQATVRVGDFWRVVTLDDEKIESRGAGDDVERLVHIVGTVQQKFQRTRRVVAKVRSTTMNISVRVLACALVVVLIPGPDWNARFERLRAIVDPGQAPDRGAPAVARVATVVLAIGLSLLALWIVVVFVTWVVSFPLRLVYGGVSRGVHEAARAEHIRIACKRDISIAQRIVELQRHRVFGARLCVLTVDSSVWQQTVTDIANVCAVPLIDISDPTEHVMWEIENLVRRFGERCVFIGDHGRLQTIARANGELTGRLSKLLDGRDVLGYALDPAGTKRFIHALSSTLAWHDRRPLPRSLVG
jgi:hypothetical protein